MSTKQNIYLVHLLSLKACHFCLVVFHFFYRNIPPSLHTSIARNWKRRTNGKSVFFSFFLICLFQLVCGIFILKNNSGLVLTVLQER